MKKKVINISKSILSLIIIVDVVFISLTIVFDVSNDFYQNIMLFDIITCILLLSDFFWGMSKSNDRKQYFKENWLEFIAAIPFDILFAPFIFLGYLKLIRLVRVLFLIGEYFRFIGSFLKNTRLDEIIAIFILIIIGSTFALYLIDPGMNNLFDILWFVVVSLTTVGYGDITPNTIPGKIVSLVLLIVGVFIFSAITGAISTYFMDNLLKEGSFHIIELKQQIGDMNKQLVKNEKQINDLKQEIKELKDIIRENNK